MALYEQFSALPDQNTKTPPLGAPQNATYLKDISKTFRYLMASVREIGDVVKTLVSSLGSCAAQNANNVNISGVVQVRGGSVDENSTVDARALKTGLVPLAAIPVTLTGKAAGGLTYGALQNLYNMIYPIGRSMLWHTDDLENSGLVWANVSATWQIVAGSEDRFLVTAGSQTAPSAGAGSQQPYGFTTTTGGGAVAAGFTDPATLGMQHLPSSVLTDIGSSGAGGGGFGTGTMQPTRTRNAGGDQPHAHGTPAIPAHTHQITRDPLRVGLVFIQRIA